jgi:hypothetical protein
LPSLFVVLRGLEVAESRYLRFCAEDLTAGMREAEYTYTLEWWLASVLCMDRIEVNVESSGL